MTLTITDDDAAPSLSIGSPSLDEGDSGQRTMPFTVRLSAASGWEATVGYGLDGTDGGTATAGTDYTAIVPGTLTFPAGTTSRSISVLVAGDTIDEPDETIRVTLSRPTNATGTPTGTGTIGDDDPTPQVTLALAPVSIAEEGGAATVTATLDRASGAATTLTVAAAPVSPAVGADFKSSANRRLEIAAGDTASTGMVTFTAVNNAVYAGNKTVTVSATAANPRAITAPAPVSSPSPTTKWGCRASRAASRPASAVSRCRGRPPRTRTAIRCSGSPASRRTTPRGSASSPLRAPPIPPSSPASPPAPNTPCG